MKLKITFLDADSIGKDIDLSGYYDIADVTIYGYTTPAQVKERIQGADVIVVNKTRVNAENMGDNPAFKLVCITATGTDNLDKEYLDLHGIAWRNVAGYSTEDVLQHTFALALTLLQHLPYYDEYVKSGRYAGDTCFSHFENVFHELCGMTWGVVGLGTIGKRVYRVAEAFGCKAVYYSTSGNNAAEGFNRVSLDELLENSDIVSVHAPLNENTRNLFNADAFKKMKDSAIFINVGRGPIVNETDLADALCEGQIAAAGVDVLCAEPMSKDNPLLGIKDSNKLIVTPHIAWASLEARQRLMDLVLKNITEFFR